MQAHNRALSALGRQGVPILVGAFGAQAAVLVTGVLSARLLGVEGRGSFSLATLVGTTAALIAGMSTPQLANLLVASGAEQLVTVRRLFRAVLPVLPVAVVTSMLLAELLIGLPIAASLAGAAVPLLLVVGLGTGVTRGAARYWTSAWTQLAGPLLFAVVLVIAVQLLPATTDTAMSAWFLSQLLAALLVLLLVYVARRRQALTSSGLPPVGEVRRRGLRSLLSTYAPLESLRLDQLAVGIFLGPAAVGLYVSAIAFSNLGRLLGQAMSGSVGRVVVGRGPTAVPLLNALWIGAGAFGLVVAAIAPALVPVAFGREFAGASALAVPLCVAGAFMAARTVLTEIARALGVEGRASLAELSATFAWIPLFACGMLLPDQLMAVSIALAIATGLSLVFTLGVLRAPMRTLVDLGPRTAPEEGSVG